MPWRNIKKKKKKKEREQEEIVNEENFNEEINLQNDEHDDNIDLDGVD